MASDKHLLDKEAPGNRADIHVFLAYIVFFSFLMKAVGEFVHEILGHGLFVMLFGGRIVGISLSLLWPYQLSRIEFGGSFQSWQLPFIYGGGMLACLATSCVAQALLLWKVWDWRVSIPVFWLGFWTFLNPAGYLVMGGMRPFGDVSQLIMDGVLSQTSSLALGVVASAVSFLSLSRVFRRIVSDSGLVRDKRQLKISVCLLWLIVPLITVMAITGLGFLGWSSPLLIAASFVPSAVSLVFPENLVSVLRR